MSELCVLAGRPGVGKTEYLNKQLNEDSSIRMVSALDFESHEALVRELYDLVQDDSCKCIVIDDYEVKLIQGWNNIIIDEEYRTNLSILAGFSDNYDIKIIVAVGLKREADISEEAYFNLNMLRSAAILSEANEILFMQQERNNIYIMRLQEESQHSWRK